MRQGFTRGVERLDSRGKARARACGFRRRRTRRGALEQMVWDEFQFNSTGVSEGSLTFARRRPEQRERCTSRARDRAPTVVPPAMGVCRRQHHPPAARGHRLPHRRALPAQLQGGQPAGVGHRLCGHARPRGVPQRERADGAGTANPLATTAGPAIRRALAHGTSQSGRYLRDFVYQGFNEDEGGRIVFEGMNPHIAAARMFLNQRFAQPERDSRSVSIPTIVPASHTRRRPTR